MKKIRLEFPLFWGEGENSKKYLPSHIWLKVVNNHTEAFKDQNLTQPLPNTHKSISVEVEVPKELEIIEVIPPGGITPVQDILMGWALDNRANPNWRMPGLKKVSIIFDNMIYEVKVIDEKPDVEGYRDYLKNDEVGKWLFFEPWALSVYSMEDKTFGAFHWHSKLAGF